MTLKEIIQLIGRLSPADRAVLRRELEETLPKEDVESATPETMVAVNKERRASHDERGMPIEDLINQPRPKRRLDPSAGAGRLTGSLESGHDHARTSHFGMHRSGQGRQAGFRYFTTKNKKLQQERIERKKYNPFLRRRTVHREKK